jgi:hypothetical protein
MRTEHQNSYKLYLLYLGLNPGHDTAGDMLLATGPEPNVPEPYITSVQVFSEADPESMASHGLQDMAIELFDGKQLP